MIAQTNIQLYNQLCRQGRSLAELTRVHAAYELAVQLFAGQYRANGKPFVAHLAGTASVLACFEQPTTVVAAGLLHSAFEFGDFGDGRHGLTTARRQRLKAVVGEESADLIAQYYVLTRREARKQAREDDLAGFSPARIAVLVMHLADTVEEYVDGGIRYAPDKEAFLRQSSATDVATETIHAAQRLGLAAYVTVITGVFKAAESCTPAVELQNKRHKSFLVIPTAQADPRLARRRSWGRLSKLFGWLRHSRSRDRLAHTS